MMYVLFIGDIWVCANNEMNSGCFSFYLNFIKKDGKVVCVHKEKDTQQYKQNCCEKRGYNVKATYSTRVAPIKRYFSFCDRAWSICGIFLCLETTEMVSHRDFCFFWDLSFLWNDGSEGCFLCRGIWNFIFGMFLFRKYIRVFGMWCAEGNSKKRKDGKKGVLWWKKFQ